MLTLRGVRMIDEVEIGDALNHPMFNHHVRNFMNVLQNGTVGEHLVVFIDHDKGVAKYDYVEIIEEE